MDIAALKAPYRDGTTHIVLEPLDLMARLAPRVPQFQSHLPIAGHMEPLLGHRRPQDVATDALESR